MKTEQLVGRKGMDWDRPPGLGEEAALAFVFGATDRLRDPALFPRIRAMYPQACLLGCTTAGEIAGTQVLEGSVTVTAVSFAETRVALVSTAIEPGEDSGAVGARLAAGLDKEGLRHVLVLSDGLMVNGTRLVQGLTAGLPPKTMVTGGLAGDGERFKETLILADAPAQCGIVAALGFYGARLRIGWGSVGGWDIFGAKRLVTRSQGNVLYELDGQPVLDLYKKYLGKHAAELPASALLFPLSVEHSGIVGNGLVRTVLSVNEEDKSMTFAGDIPEGSRATLMYANFDRLVDGAGASAQQSLQVSGVGADLALCISCVGRKLILKQRVEDETEAVQDILGEHAMLAGFYSYGEISPLAETGRCELHNQTMTITTFTEE
ncbi:MAG: hypothetical protein A2051_04605 [Desulfovibrionales bacterium GWA2_65_9]|nr:MAG: hypothetical protein A2051_04605 [Desulfovibrionales bacterium GWA2_65_9]